MSRHSCFALLARAALTLAPVTAVLRDYLPSLYISDHPVSPFRVLIATMALVVLARPAKQEWLLLRTNRTFITAMFIWLGWGALSLLWSPDPDRGKIELLAILFGFAIVVAVLSFCNGNEDRYRALRIGWTIALAIACGIGIFEYVTGHHLGSQHEEFMAKHYSGRQFVQSSFGNENNFAAFLLIAIPFVVHGVVVGKRLRILHFGLLLVACFGLALTNSRTGFFGLIVESAVGLFMLVRCRRLRRSALIAVLIATALVVMVSKNERIEQKLHGLASDTGIVDSSWRLRKNQMMNGLTFLADTAGIGVGAGGFQSSVIDRGKYDTHVWHGTLVDPHATVIEIGSQYGILVLVFALVVAKQQFSCVRKAFIATQGERRTSAPHVAWVAGLGMAGAACGSFANSTSLAVPTNWVFLGSLLAITTHLQLRSARAPKRALQRLGGGLQRNAVWLRKPSSPRG